MSSKDRSGLVENWLAIGAVAMFLLFAVLIGALITGIGPFAATGSTPSAGSAGAGAGAEATTGAPAASSSATGSVSSQARSTTERQTPAGQSASTSAETRSSAAGRDSTSAADEGFGTLTDRSSTTPRSPVETFDTATRENTAESESNTESTPGRDATATERTEGESNSGSGSSTGGSEAVTATEGYSNEDFSSDLESEGISVETLFNMEGSATGGGSTAVLDYTTQASSGGYRDEAGRVGKVYASAVEKGYQPQLLSVTVYTANDDPVASYRIKRAWAVAYASGDISAQEYGERIGETFRTY